MRHAFRTGFRPCHPRLFESLRNDDLAGAFDQSTAYQVQLTRFQPASGFLRVLAIPSFGYIIQMLGCVVVVQYLNSVGVVQREAIPYPRRPITKTCQIICVLHALVKCKRIDLLAKSLGSLESCRILGVADPGLVAILQRLIYNPTLKAEFDANCRNSLLLRQKTQKVDLS